MDRRLAGVAYRVESRRWIALLTPRIDWSYRSEAFMDAINTPAIRSLSPRACSAHR